MKSSIFNFIGEFSSTLEELAIRVETLLWDQPQPAMTQARLFGEMLVSMIFEQENMNEVYPLKQVEKINRLYRQDIIQDDIYKKLEYIRKKGNIASHQVLEMDQEVAKQAHQALFDLSIWYMEVYVSHTFRAPTYELPSTQKQDHHDMKKWMDTYIQETTKRLTEIEEHLEQLKQEKQQESLVIDKEKSKVNKSPSSVKSNERIVPLERFESAFKKVNFNMTNLTKKAAEFEHEANVGSFVYLLDNVSPTIAIHPSLVEQDKMLMDVPNKQIKNTALRRFPKKEEGGKLMSNFGYTYTFQTKKELEELLQRIVKALGS
ncbi:hypothetical protein CIB95_13010 [Lottiidibacillus patelloidae]|uniref:Uncharacterized protein n=1 Tax=Lottiidibacillus patelloidae TaxID=2670334 RepID=A0A263BRY3_9BACI|nr:DUF4145 domain-containing protein [Lottiidibacillus patelloidae]OZM56328.1 hypothetical protein CIB95_13010 [Lottiidibacillus patelloidae]